MDYLIDDIDLYAGNILVGINKSLIVNENYKSFENLKKIQYCKSLSEYDHSLEIILIYECNQKLFYIMIKKGIISHENEITEEITFNDLKEIINKYQLMHQYSDYDEIDMCCLEIQYERQKFKINKLLSKFNMKELSCVEDINISMDQLNI